MDCGICHQDIAKEYRQNFHYLQEDFRCSDCHRNIHAIKQDNKKNVKLAIIEKCTECHGNTDYAASGHGEAVLKGNQDAAELCRLPRPAQHPGLPHLARAIPGRGPRVLHTEVQALPRRQRHHEAEQTLRQNGGLLRIHLPREGAGMGYPAPVAGCADCHTRHNILPSEDPRSSINPANLEQNCGRCHSGFQPRFLSYKAHPDYRDRDKYPSLYWTFLFMSGLLVGTLAFFWSHVILWWRKVYWDHHYMDKMGILPPSLTAKGEGLQQIERFSPKERVMHVLLILSFFTLVLTGFPVGVSETAWPRIS